MKLLDYIRGLRKGKEAHRLETRVDAGSFPGRCYGWLQPGGGKSRTTDRETADAGFSSFGKEKEHPCYHSGASLPVWLSDSVSAVISCS